MTLAESWIRRWRRRLWTLRVLRGDARRWAVRRLLEGSAARERRLAAAAVGDAGRLVFVCHGNIMRSAFAVQVARAHAPQWADRIVGGGTHARAGRPAQMEALAVSRVLGQPLDDHAATPLEALALSPYDVVICMDALNEANVLAAVPGAAARVFRAGDIRAGDETAHHGDREIVDPYARGEEATRDAFVRVTVLTRAWVDHAFVRHVPVV